MHKTYRIIKLNNNDSKARSIYGLKQLCLKKELIVAVMVMCLIIFLFLPSSVAVAEEDLSASDNSQLTDLTDTTKALLNSLEKEIEIYYIAQEFDQDENVKGLLYSYDDYSSNITVSRINQVINQDFLEDYTDETLQDNSVVVVCGDRSRVISYDDMYEYEYIYTYYTNVTTGFDAEGHITSAIAGLISEDIPKLYTLTEHGEVELSTTLDKEIEKENIEVAELNLETATAVPEDADCLLIASPTSDLSSAEAEKVINYLHSGGSTIIITDYLGVELPNLDTILDYYGTELVDGVIMEADINYYIQIPYYLVPNINSTEVSEDMTGGVAYVLMAAAQGIDATGEEREDITITSILTTSNSSYSKTDVENITTYNEESGDIDGPFDIGVLITEGSNTTETKVALFTTSTLIDDSANEMINGGNYQLFINTLNWACNNTETYSVPAKEMYSD